jgi:hypothetical protein
VFLIFHTSIALLIEFAVISTIVVVPTANAPVESTGTSDSSATDTSTNILPTSSSAAGLSYPVQTGLLGLFSLLGFALA